MAGQYLEKRGNVWYAKVEVPKKLRKLAGKDRFIKSLETGSLKEAEERKHRHVADFKRRIRALRNGESDELAKLLTLADQFKDALDNADRDWQEGPNGHEWNDYDDELDNLKEQAQSIKEQYGPEVARRFFKAAKGEATLVSDKYPDWLNEVQVTEHTKFQHGSAIRQFLAWAGHSISIEEINRKKAGSYVTELMQSPKARRTVKRHVSTLSVLWQWLVGRGYAQDNPWRNQQLGKKPPKMVRKGLDDETLLKLLNGTYSAPKYAQVLRDVTRLALLTGARFDELCSLKATDVFENDDGFWLQITQGKTDAAERSIPLHPIGVPIVKRLLEGGDEFLFAGLEPGGPDKKRSFYVSKVYGRFRKQVGVAERGKDFHALRNTFITMMEGQDVPESTVKLIVGHKRTSMTFGHYSKGERVKLREAIDKLAYGTDVMNLLQHHFTKAG